MHGPLLSFLWFAGLAATQSSTASPSVITLSGYSPSLSRLSVPIPTVPSVFEGSTFATFTSPARSGFSANATSSSSTTAEEILTIIGGNNSTRTYDATVTVTAPARPSNTQPCNNYVEFCTRKYSNITEVCAHNSPYVRENNAASNQQYGVTQQLNDGIRVLQGSAHYVNNTLYYCHSSCDLLNAGTVEDYLREVTAWVEAHPFDVITIIFGNSNWGDKDSDGNPIVTSRQFAEPIAASGLIDFIYQPPKTAMALDDWPTLGEMILQNKRVVTFIDYNFDTGAVPYLLWEFYNIWETPFSPTDLSFPCTLGRPEGISEDQMKNIMYMANHNLNAEIAFGGFSVLVPNVAELNKTNGLAGDGSLGGMTQECTAKWDRPPNFLLVDFYNHGPTNGSVFEVAALANGVQYDRECCGTWKSQGVVFGKPSSTYFGAVVAIAAALLI